MKRKFILSIAVLSVLALLSYGYSSRNVHAQGRSQDAGPPETIPHRMNERGADNYSLTTGGTAATSPINYGGGQLIRTPTVYVIWYGNWNQGNGSDTPAGQQIVRDFVNGIGGSAYFNINTSYSINGYTITGGVANGGETTDAYSQGTRLKDSSILTIVNNAITSSRLPYNANGVYFVLTSTDVNETSGFCRQYCGWHTAATPSAGHVRYSFVGNANRCLNGCAAQTISPNSNPGVDGMISVIAHELEEATTDPDPRSGWTDSGGAENADKCAWTFGHAQYQVANGSWANMTLGSRNFLIQRNLYHNLNGSGSDFCMVNSTQN
jgi:hypothetical protein